MPEAEDLYLQQLNEDRARQEKWLAQDRQRQAESQSDELNEQQLNEDRARQEMQETAEDQETAQQVVRAKSKPEPVPFPWLMLCVAIIFDLVGFIPIVNIFADILACLILWIWKHTYNSKTNPLIDIVAAKIVDFLCLGFLPSSTFTVVYSYIKKKTAAKAKTKIGGRVIAKFAT
jgi:hypothetical protein